MRNQILKGATVLLSAGALMGLGLAPAGAETSSHEIQQTVHVRGNGSSVSLDDATVWAGSIHFAVSTSNGSNGSSIILFQPKPGKTVGRVVQDFMDESGPPRAAAEGTRELTADAMFFGLADVVAGHPATVTETLKPGTYFLVDVANPPSGPPPMRTLTVKPAKANIEQDSDLVSQTTVLATSADRFVAPRNWHHEGTLTFRNTSDTLHFMSLSPVRDGTTEQQVKAYLDSQPTGPPPFARSGPSVGVEVTSPGVSLQLSYDLPRGTYVALCFIADDVTGMPHALMGMYKVIVLT
jgi:hypothetical protein